MASVDIFRLAALPSRPPVLLHCPRFFFFNMAINLISNQSSVVAPASSLLMEDMTGLDLALLIPPFLEPRTPLTERPGAIDHYQ